MPWWAWVLVGAAGATVVGYVGLAWWLRSWGRDF
jgi:hypothetical protein